MKRARLVNGKKEKSWFLKSCGSLVNKLYEFKSMGKCRKHSADKGILFNNAPLIIYYKLCKL